MLEILNSFIILFPALVYVLYVDLFNLHLTALREVLEDVLQANDSEFSTISTVKTVKTRILPYNLSTLKSIHLSLCEIHEKINECVGKTVAFYVFHATFQMIQHGYSCFLALITHDVNFTFFHRLCAICFRLIVMIFPVRASEKHRKEVRIIKSII